MPAPSYIQKKEGRSQRAEQATREKLDAAAASSTVKKKEVVKLKPTANQVVNAVEKNTVSKGKNLNDSIVASSSEADINLETQIIGSLLGQTLRLKFKNNNADPITPPKYITETLKQVDALIQNQNAKVQMHTKDSLLFPFRLLDPETLARYKRGFVSEDGETIAAGASRTYYLPILADCFALNEFFMMSIKGGLQYKLTFDATAWVDGYPTLVGCDMISRHLYYSQDWMDALKREYALSSKTFNFRSYTVKKFTATLIGGDLAEQSLETYGGDAIEIFMQIYANGEKIEDLGNYIDSFDITDADNQSYISSGPIDSTYDDLILYGVHDYTPVVGTDRDPWTCLSFSNKMVNDFLTGQVHGHRQFDKSEILKINVSSDLPAGAYHLRLTFGELAQFRSEGGNLKVL
jgi:hypothetical protein